MMRNQLKRNWDNAANAYLLAFCGKHGYDFEGAWWVADDPGTIAEVGDYTVGMATIRTDIDLDAPESSFAEWYDYCLRLGMVGETSTPNFDSWLRGCPRKSEEDYWSWRPPTNGRVAHFHLNAWDANDTTRQQSSVRDAPKDAEGGTAQADTLHTDEHPS